MNAGAPRAALRCRPGPRGIVLIGLAFAVYLAGVVLLGDWIVDDAGISYAYARNLAGGHGFVSQPGRVPVEGVSDFLWVTVLGAFFELRLFHPVLTPKTLGAACVLGAMWILRRTLRRRTGGELQGFVASLLLAASPPIVIWTSSGLENGMTLLLASALYATLVERPPRWQARAGALVALLAMTHPEGLAFLACGALVLTGDAVAGVRRGAARRGAGAAAGGFLLDAGAYLAGFAALFGPFFAYRLSAFGLPWPYPYYAKRVFPSLWDRLASELGPGRDAALRKLVDLGCAVTGGRWPLALLAPIFALAVLGALGRLRRWLAVAIVVQLVSVATYVVIDDDWMGEYRFATVAVAASIVVLVGAGVALLGGVARALTSSPRPWTAVAALAAAGAACVGFASRTVGFAQNATTPLADVQRRLVDKLDAYASLLGVEHGSAMVADAGAPLYRSRLTIYDLAGLTEPDVVHTLKRDTPTWFYDHPAFFDWVFDVRKPTFISTYGFWTNVASLDDDARFSRDYVGVDAFEDEYVRGVYGRTGHRSGDFVRRDALRGTEDLERLRRDYRAAPRREPLVDRLLERAQQARGRPAPDAATLRAQAAEALAGSRPNPDRAACLLARAVDLAPGDAALLEELAKALDAAQRPDEARPFWRQVLATAGAEHDAPRALAARTRLGDRPAGSGSVADALAEIMKQGLDALYVRHAPRDAEPAFRAVLAANPSHYGATYQLAVALDAEGKAAEARAVWRTVLELALQYADQPTAARARARLEP